MKLYNAGTTTLVVSDITVDGYPLEWLPAQTLTLYDEDVERSARIKALVTAGTLTVTGEAEPNEGLEMPEKDDTTETATFQYNVAVSHAAEGLTHPSISAGTYGASNALIDTALIDNIFASVNVRTATNKTTADTSCMAVYVGNGNTADTIHNKMQGILSSMNIGFDVFDAYAGQFHIAISDTMATHDGNANLVGLSAKANIADGKVATGNVSALSCVLDTGTGTAITGTYDVIRIENNATGCNSAINFGATTNMAYLFNMSTGGCVAASTTTTTSADGYSIKVNINGEDCYIRCAKTA
jgi:hypothetical protein